MGISSTSEEFVVRGIDRKDVGHGTTVWEVDFGHLAVGKKASAAHIWDVTGRPKLAAICVIGLRRIAKRGISKDTVDGYRNTLRVFWTFLDEMEAVASSEQDGAFAPEEIWHIPGILWALYKDWLEASPQTASALIRYHACKMIFDAAAKHVLQEEAHLFGFPLPPNPFKRKAGAASKSYSPEELQLVGKRLMAFIERSETRLRLGKEALQETDRTSFGLAIKELRTILDTAGWRLQKAVYPPNVLADLPANKQSLRQRNSYDRCLWLTPSKSDLSAVFGLFMLRSGWNIATILDMSASDWSRPHPVRPRQVEELFSLKKRANSSTQHTYSLRNQRFHQYHLISLVAEWTAPVRTAIKQRIKWLQDQPHTKANEAELNRLKSCQNRLWVFCGYENDFGQLTRSCVKFCEEIINQNNDKNSDAIKFNQSITRDSWAAFAYESTGFNLLLTQIALGHSDLKSLLFYLNQKAISNHHRREFSNLQSLILDTAGSGTMTPIALFAKASKGGLSAEEAATIAEGKTRTRHGVFCANPTSPDIEVAPRHIAGQLCLEQDCLGGCSKAFATFDTLKFATGRMLQLRELREQMPFPAWMNSDYPHDLQFFEELVMLYSEDNRKLALESAFAMPLPPTSFLPSASNLRKVQ